MTVVTINCRTKVNHSRATLPAGVAGRTAVTRHLIVIGQETCGRESADNIESPLNI